MILKPDVAELAVPHEASVSFEHKAAVLKKETAKLAGVSGKKSRFEAKEEKQLSARVRKSGISRSVSTAAIPRYESAVQFPDFLPIHQNPQQEGLPGTSAWPIRAGAGNTIVAAQHRPETALQLPVNVITGVASSGQTNWLDRIAQALSDECDIRGLDL